MQPLPLTIHVSPDVIELYKSASPEQRKWALKLFESAITTDKKSAWLKFDKVTRKVSKSAEKRGLTDEVLKDILSEKE
ncbi:MAG TPA: hypothetical protein VGL56_13075 [Fimbriimonadaceae bacterium]|jgi:hypothetical protein